MLFVILKVRYLMFMLFLVVVVYCCLLFLNFVVVVVSSCLLFFVFAKNFLFLFVLVVISVVQSACWLT